MKNIHLLPTDKPSSLYYKDDKYKLANSTMAIDWYISSAGYKPTNIYITSDEEIKEGDYYITILDNQVFKADSSTIRIMNDSNKSSETTYRNTHFKIILTTDQDLIKDGVQAIDDEFLEWFVKNPSCEFVEVQKWFDGVDFLEYKIIIPQEEPIQELLPDFKITKNIFDFVTDLSDTNKKEPKQETIEEILPKNSNGKYSRNEIEKAFEQGAKWQAQRMYSEEEVLNLLYERESELNTHNSIFDYQDAKEWFEQFKKK
jgi:hypothetical protein